MLPSVPLVHFGHDRFADLPSQLLAVIGELTTVMMEENAFMAEGMPAAVAETVDRKLELSDSYDELFAELADNRAQLLAADPDFTARMMAAVVRLREVTAENLTRLEAAMEASRRRVEAVMAATRSTLRDHAPYGANGDVPLGARLAAFGKDYHA